MRVCSHSGKAAKHGHLSAFFVLLVPFVDYKADVHERHERHEMDSVIFFAEIRACSPSENHKDGHLNAFFVLLVPFVDYREDVHERHERHEMDSVIFFCGDTSLQSFRKTTKMDI